MGEKWRFYSEYSARTDFFDYPVPQSFELPGQIICFVSIPHLINLHSVENENSFLILKNFFDIGWK
jgi:hypothetical protein